MGTKQRDGRQRQAASIRGTARRAELLRSLAVGEKEVRQAGRQPDMKGDGDLALTARRVANDHVGPLAAVHLAERGPRGHSAAHSGSLLRNDDRRRHRGPCAGLMNGCPNRRQLDSGQWSDADEKHDHDKRYLHAMSSHPTSPIRAPLKFVASGNSPMLTKRCATFQLPRRFPADNRLPKSSRRPTSRRRVDLGVVCRPNAVVLHEDFSD